MGKNTGSFFSSTNKSSTTSSSSPWKFSKFFFLFSSSAILSSSFSFIFFSFIFLIKTRKSWSLFLLNAKFINWKKSKYNLFISSFLYFFPLKNNPHKSSSVTFILFILNIVVISSISILREPSSSNCKKISFNFKIDS